VANFVQSFGERVKQYFTPRPVGRRAKSAFPSFFQRCWRTVPPYLPFYILIAVLAYALYYGLQPATVIAPFHLPPENKEHPLPFSGEAVADAVQDAITSIQQEAEGQPLTSPCDFLAPKEQQFGGLKAEAGSSFQVRGPVTVEVKGISPEAVKSAAREVLGNERYISGDVILSGLNSFQLMARANDRGPWMTKPQDISLDALKYASCELAERILGATNKNVLAAAWIRREKYKEVIDLYVNLSSKGGDPDALNNLGIALRETGKLDDAIARFRQALAKHRWLWFPEAHYNLGLALENKGRYDAAIAEYRKAIELKPDNAMAHNNLGNALDDKGQTEEAIAEFRKAIGIKSDDVLAHAYAHYNLGVVLFAKGRTDAAIAEYRQAIELKPDDPDPHVGLGWALYNKGQYDEAIADYRQALELKSDDAMAHNDLGLALGVKAQTDAAIAEYQAAIEIKSDDILAHAYAHNNLGNILLNKGQTDAAIAEYRQAIELKPDYQTARDNLAKALAQK